LLPSYTHYRFVNPWCKGVGRAEAPKVLIMALSDLLPGDPKNRRHWIETGAGMRLM
jgi:hypothetical protein